MAKKGGLGKGLDSLIPNKVNTKQLNSGVEAKKSEEKADLMVKISKVEPNREQPRKKFDEKKLEELAASIKKHGVLQPLVVQDCKDYYQIIAGERRWRAAKIAGLKEVPVIIKNLTPQEIMEISLIENIQREELNPIEEAVAYRRLLDEFHLKQEELAERVSKSRTTITNSVRLLKLSEAVQKLVISGKLSTGHARTLITLDDPDQQLAIAKQIIDEKLSVRQTEELIKKLQTKKKQRKAAEKDEQLELILADMSRRMTELMGTKVQIKNKGKNRGNIEISYYSQDELEHILDALKSYQKEEK